MLKLTTDKHEASRGLSATAELLVRHVIQMTCGRDRRSNAATSNSNKQIFLELHVDCFLCVACFSCLSLNLIVSSHIRVFHLVPAFWVNRQLDVAYIDIKSAFDSVDRVALWKALRGSGMPPFLLQLIHVRDLHTGTTARVRTPQGMSDVFYTTSGVRQGCILAPALFWLCDCCAIDCLMRHCSGCFGVDVGNFHLTDINYADDAVLFTDDPTKWDLLLLLISSRPPCVR